MKVQVQKTLTIPVEELIKHLRLPVGCRLWFQRDVHGSSEDFRVIINIHVKNPIDKKPEYRGNLSRVLLSREIRKLSGLGRWVFFWKVSIAYLDKDLQERRGRHVYFEIKKILLEWEETQKLS